MSLDDGLPEAGHGDAVSPLPEDGAAFGIAAQTDPFRAVVRAIGELRRGAPVIFDDGCRRWLVGVVETLSAFGAALFGSARSPVYLVGPGAWAGPGRDRPAVRDVGHMRVPFDPRLFLADLDSAATTDRPIETTGPATVSPACADGVIALAKQGHLLPQLLVTRQDLSAEGLVAVTGREVAAYIAAAGELVRVGEASVPLEDARSARLVAYRNPASGAEHVAVVIGTPESARLVRPALVRLHSECFTGDVLGSLRCDCGPQLRSSLRRMAEEGAGVVLYLAQEGRGIGLVNKLRAYALQDRGLDTVDANTTLGFAADERQFSMAATMLRDLGLSAVRLMTNNPAKVAALAAAGLAVERCSLLVAPNGIDDAYLATKAARFGHLL